MNREAQQRMLVKKQENVRQIEITGKFTLRYNCYISKKKTSNAK